MSSTSKRKLYLHIGTPKTGTSSLQYFLFENSARLKSEGLLYPVSLIGSHRDPKHQPFFHGVYNGNCLRFNESLRNLSVELKDSGCSALLSSEGFYHHLYEFTEQSWRLIRELAGLYDLRVLVYLRPQSDYVESMYRQYLKNPKGANEEYGTGMTMNEFLGRPRIRQNLDYYGSLMQWSRVVGESNIVVRRYGKNILADFQSLFHLRVEPPQKSVSLNPSLTREMAELLRQVNSHWSNERRNALILNMEKSAAPADAGRDASFLSPPEQRSLMDRLQEGNTLVARKWLNESELFPGHAIGDCRDWEPVRIDRDRMLSLFGCAPMHSAPANLPDCIAGGF